jgi:hypothetical protein
MMRSVHLHDDFGGGVLEGLYEMNNLLESKLPWEEEDGVTLIQPRKGVCRELIPRAYGEIY